MALLGNSIVRLALCGTLILFSVIILGLSAKLVNDGREYNKLLKQAYSSSLTADLYSSFVKRDVVIGRFIYFNAPVAAYALDLSVALLTIIGAGGAIFLSTVVQGTALIFIVIDGLLAILWLAAMAYSASAFNRAGLFTTLDIFQLAKADFAFVVLSFLLSLTLLAVSLLGFFGAGKADADAEAVPAPPAADAPVQVPYDNGGVPQAHEEHFGMPVQNEKPQQPTMQVPV